MGKRERRGGQMVFEGPGFARGERKVRKRNADRYKITIFR